MLSPHIAIAGGGPAGFLVGLLLAQCHLPCVTLLEQSPVADPWSSKSYSISVTDRGLGAVEAAGVLRQVHTAGTIRNKVIMEMPGGIQRELPKDPPNYAITRPALVECLEQCLQAQAADQDGVTIKRGVAVTGVTNDNENGLLKVELDDGSTLECTHLVAADGKWSAVRNSIPELETQFEVQEEPAFGVIMSSTVKSPERWSPDATTLFVPDSKDQTYYCLAAPLPDGQYSVSAICFDEIQIAHPWLVPPEDGSDGCDQSDKTWEAEYSVDTSAQAKDSVQENFAKLLQEELPLFYQDLTNGDDDTEHLSFRINRRTSWLKPRVEHPQYTDATGRVALIGDAAHAMTPSQGEGCNCALESAVSLTQSLLEQVKEGKDLSVEDITEAFQAYGTIRPSEVLPIQIKSA
ncbi:MAG: hypothetical protein SGARI_002403, partial [Bacillariaceae sp.]